MICVKCDAEVKQTWGDVINRRLVAKKLCFTCDHWSELVTEAGRSMSVRVKGKHYQIGPEDGSLRACMGFGGKQWRIKFHDGRRTVTTNLWYQGTIPERFRSLLPDNAVFDADMSMDV